MAGQDLDLLGVSLEAPRVAVGHARRGWWRRFPPVPAPSREHLAWRITTAYGSADVRPPLRDMIEYVAWRRRYRRSTR